MAIRISWDKYEAAILLYACINVLNKEISRNDAVKMVSDKLRARALKNGIEIDDKFRNTNGIALQMSAMMSLLIEKP